MYKIKVKHIRSYTQIISLRCSERKYSAACGGVLYFEGANFLLLSSSIPVHNIQPMLMRKS